jgi:hypothetical protein
MQAKRSAIDRSTSGAVTPPLVNRPRIMNGLTSGTWDSTVAPPAWMSSAPVEA